MNVFNLERLDHLVDADDLFANANQQEPVDPQGPLFECLIDRDQTELPSDYVPEAEGVNIAGEGMLRAAGYRLGSNRPRAWTKRNCHVYRKKTDDCRARVLQVRRCGDFWIVERWPDWDTSSSLLCALTCAFSGRPIWTRGYQAAMRLAEHCDPSPRTPVAGCWKKARPTWFA
jgi:hypothetical protein